MSCRTWKRFARVSVRTSQPRRPCSSCSAIVKVEMTSPEQACEQEDRPCNRVHILDCFRSVVLAFSHLKWKSSSWDRYDSFPDGLEKGNYKYVFERGYTMDMQKCCRTPLGPVFGEGRPGQLNGSGVSIARLNLELLKMRH